MIDTDFRVLPSRPSECSQGRSRKHHRPQATSCARAGTGAEARGNHRGADLRPNNRCGGTARIRPFHSNDIIWPSGSSSLLERRERSQLRRAPERGPLPWLTSRGRELESSLDCTHDSTARCSPRGPHLLSSHRNCVASGSREQK